MHRPALKMCYLGASQAGKKWYSTWWNNWRRLLWIPHKCPRMKSKCSKKGQCKWQMTCKVGCCGLGRIYRVWHLGCWAGGSLPSDPAADRKSRLDKPSKFTIWRQSIGDLWESTYCLNGWSASRFSNRERNPLACLYARKNIRNTVDTLRFSLRWYSRSINNFKSRMKCFSHPLSFWPSFLSILDRSLTRCP